MNKINRIASCYALLISTMTSLLTADLKEFALAIIDNIKIEKANGDWFSNLPTSGAYAGCGFPACPTINNYNPQLGFFLSFRLDEFEKQNFDISLFGSALKDCNDISYFIVVQDFESACISSLDANAISPSLKPQHWLMKEIDDTTFNYTVTYPFSCEVGLFNTGICDNVVSTPTNQIAIDKISPANGLCAHEWKGMGMSMLSGNVLNFTISKKDKLCAFFSIVKVTDEKLTTKRGAAVTLHVIIPQEKCNEFVRIKSREQLSEKLISIIE